MNDDEMTVRIINLSRGLVEVKQNDGIQVVQLIHQSVSDFILGSGFHLLEESLNTANSASHGHYCLSRSCLRYLASDEVRIKGIRIQQKRACSITYEDGEIMSADIKRAFPFAKYCTSYWIKHVTRVEEELGEHLPQNDLLTFFFPQSRILDTWTQFHDGLKLMGVIKETTFLYIVARYGLSSIVDAVLDQAEVEADHPNEIHYSPLHLAAENGLEIIVRALLQHATVQVNRKDGVNQTPLHKAAKNGHAIIVRLLIQHEAIDMNAQDFRHRAPIHYAVEGNYQDVVKLLSGASTYSAVDKQALSAASLEAGKPPRPRRKGDPDINAKALDGQTALHIAMERGLWAMVRLLILCGADVNTRNIYGCTPLVWSITCGNVPDDETITRFNANFLEVDRRGDEPKISPSSLQRLIKKEVEIDRAYKYGRTVLFFAVTKGSKNVARALLELGADVNHQDSNTESMLACLMNRNTLPLNSHWELAELLLQFGADVNARGEGGKTLIMHAWDFEWAHDIFDILLDNRPDPDIQDNFGNTILHRILSPNSYLYTGKKALEAIGKLIRVRASLTIRNHKGETPRDMAQTCILDKGVDRSELLKLLGC